MCGLNISILKLSKFNEYFLPTNYREKKLSGSEKKSEEPESKWKMMFAKDG